MLRILCKLGFHKWIFHHRFYPDIGAPIVSRYVLKKECRRCDKSVVLTDWRYDLDHQGREFLDKNKGKEDLDIYG